MNGWFLLVKKYLCVSLKFTTYSYSHLSPKWFITVVTWLLYVVNSNGSWVNGDDLMDDDFLTRPKWLGVKHELRWVGNIYVSRRLFKIASHSNKTVCISSYDNLLLFKPFINNSFTPFTSLSKNSTYHGGRGKFKCYSINLLATKFLLSPETKIDPSYDMTLFTQQQCEVNRLKFRKMENLCWVLNLKKWLCWQRMYIM